jgi:hypothetical protein
LVKIFISHSKRDSWLVEPVSAILKDVGVNPYVAGIETPEAKSLPRKFHDNIQNSNCVILLLTKNVMKHQNTRDIINWEIAAAHTLSKPVYVFREEGVEVPLMISYITDYYTFKKIMKKDIEDVLTRIRKIAQILKDNEDTVKAVLTIIGAGLGILLLAYLASRAK